MKNTSSIEITKNKGISIEKIVSGEHKCKVLAKVEGQEIARIGYGLTKWDEESCMVYDVFLEMGNWKDPNITEALTRMIDFLKAEGNGAVAVETELFSNDDTEHQERDEALSAAGFVKDESNFPGSVMYYYNGENGDEVKKNPEIRIERICVGEHGREVLAKVEGQEIARIGYGITKWDEDSCMVYDVFLEMANWKDPNITEALTRMIDFLKTEGNGAVAVGTELFSNDDTEHQERDEVMAAVGFEKDESNFPGSVMYYYNGENGD